MDVETQRWLSPLITALLDTELGSAAFQRFMQAAVTAHSDEDPPGVDWIRIGQMIRNELDWDHYPPAPPRRTDDNSPSACTT